MCVLLSIIRHLLRLKIITKEIGRAGRDGQESYAFLLWNRQELGEMDDVLSAQIPDKTQYLKVISYIYSIFQIADGELRRGYFSWIYRKCRVSLRFPLLRLEVFWNFFIIRKLYFGIIINRLLQ